MGLAGPAFICSGGIATLIGLIRLGWRRHGASMIDLGFLHLDWVGRPSLPYWRAHVANLSIFAGGIASISLGLALVLSHRWHSSPDGGRQD
jgi:hypothetical protein